MPPRITLNPALENCPDFSSEPFGFIRDTLVATNQITHEQAAIDLSTAWNLANDARTITWNQQEEEDRLARDEASRAAQEEQDLRRAQIEQEAEAERREKEKKKPKLNGFDENKVVGNSVAPRPAAFALNKLENFEFVELWYFTQEGCLDASDTHRTVADEAFGLSKVDGFIALKPIASFKASRSVLRDVDLTWRQMTMGKTSLLHHMARAGWSASHTTALAHFFLNLEMSDYRSRPNGERILLAYQARVRREWHDALKRDEGFNIGIINDNLLRAIADEIWDIIRAEGMKKVSPPPLSPSQINTFTNCCFPPPLDLNPHDPCPTTRYILLRATPDTCYTLHPLRAACYTRYTLHATFATCYTRYTLHLLHATPAACHLLSTTYYVSLLATCYILQTVRYMLLPLHTTYKYALLPVLYTNWMCDNKLTNYCSCLVY
jgi:hypothetical protein